MEEQKYYIKISPEVILSDLQTVTFTASTGVTYTIDEACCDFTSFTENFYYTTGQTKVYLRMSQVVTGGTSGTSLMTGLTIPVLFTQNTVDVGYYSVFDGAIVQKDVICNFIFCSHFTAGKLQPVLFGIFIIILDYFRVYCCYSKTRFITIS